MADTLDQFLRTTKRFYKELKHRKDQGKIGIDQLICPIDDISTQSTFSLDRFIQNIHGVVFRHPDSGSVVRPYEAGTGDVYSVQHISEKTPISEQLRDAVITGIESLASYSEHNMKLLTDIMEQHMAGHRATRWKLAIDLIRTGKFSPTGPSGVDLGFEIDFSRDGSLDLTADFGSVDIDTALKAVYDELADNGVNRDNLTFILGASWMSQLENDSDVLTKMQANAANEVISLNRMPEAFKNTQHLYLVGTYRIPGTVTSVNLCGYSPDSKYEAYKGASEVNFLPDDEMIAFSYNSPRYRVFRGIDALNDAQKAVRVAGEVVFDNYTEKDPVTEFLRSQARFAFIPGNVNHTARSTGTFPES